MRRNGTGQRVADYDQVVQTVARADVESGAVLLAGAFYMFMKAAFK